MTDKQKTPGLAFIEIFYKAGALPPFERIAPAGGTPALHFRAPIARDFGYGRIKNLCLKLLRQRLALLLCLFFLNGNSLAHDHVGVGLARGSETQLGMEGPAMQTAVFIPLREPFSSYLPNFPGGWHISELTFTTETDSLNPADGADPRIELISVSGPAGGSFAFWEVGATSPTWSRAAGWNSGQGGIPSFPVVLNGDGHAHGRAFTMDRPGNYTVAFRAVDANGLFSASANHTMVFRAQQPPQLSISIVGGNATLSFTSRDNFVYDLQRCEDLASGIWSNVAPHTFLDGNGSVIPMTDPVGGRMRAFYRLVEY
jgi:hypothetical protein